MSTEAAVGLALFGAALLVLLFAQPVKTFVSGIFVKDRKGRMTIVLTPVPKKRKRKKR